MKAKYLLVVTLLFTIINSTGQEARVKAANKQYEGYAYSEAIKSFEKLAASGYKSLDMYQKLGNAYYLNAEPEKANKWFTMFFEKNDKNDKIDAEYYYKYSQTLKSVGNYIKADSILNKFNEISKNDERARLFALNKDYKQKIEANGNNYIITDAGINSEYYDYGTSFSNNKLVFASTRASIDNKKNTQWTGQPYTTLFASELMNDGKLGIPQQFSKTLNTTLNEDSPVFTKDGKTVYFTRNNFINGKQRTDKNRTTLLKLYKATLTNGVYANIEELPINSDEYSTGHAALSTDEKTLYFASDRPGTKGQSDLFKVAINPNGSFGVPQNLENVNTPGRETFPFVSNDNQLYFATDGRPGLGGLDIFVSGLENENPSEPQNIGIPLNSPKDDFALYIDSKLNSGYITSNRLGGKGFDDIYKFEAVPKPVCVQELVGTITDAETREILPNVQIFLLDSEQNEIASMLSDSQGKYSFKVDCAESYIIKANKIAYSNSKVKILIPEISGTTNVPIQLKKELMQEIIPAEGSMKIGDDLAKLLNIKMIYFNLNKSFIRPDAALELSKILAVMKLYPNMKIAVKSHTDCRATAKYNKNLSDKRAKSSVAWIVAQGINNSRLSGKGYGETQLLNKCADNVKCTEAEHQANRRSEFIIVAL